MRINDVLKKYRPGLKYEQLSPEELEVATGWLRVLSAKQLTIEDVKGYIREWIHAVENELVDTPERMFMFFVNPKHTFLKARLKNYLFIENLISSVDRAKKALEKQLENRRAWQRVNDYY